MKGYTVNFTTKTLTMTKTFAQNASDPESDEFQLLKKMQQAFPNMRIVRKTHRPSQKHGTNQCLSYEKMEKHISVYENSAELLQVFDKIKRLAKAQKNPYKYVANWFAAQFPNFDSYPVFENGSLYITPVPAPEIKECKLQEAG